MIKNAYRWRPAGDVVGRLEEVLDRLLLRLDVPFRVDWSKHHCARWLDQRRGFKVIAQDEVSSARLALVDIIGCEPQKQKLYRNTQQFLKGLPANNVLLWGARGTGKSSLIHALMAELGEHGLRMIEVSKHELARVESIVASVENQPYFFILYCDDLSFDAEDDHYKSLKSALEGSLLTKAKNVLIYATSNRRHLVKEYRSDNDAVGVVDNEIHYGDLVEEKMSLSDRFGLWLSFYAVGQPVYLDIAKHWVVKLADRYGLEQKEAVWGEGAKAEALRWSLEKGVRNGRTAYQFAMHWVGSIALEQ